MELLQDYRAVWERKPSLRLVYGDFFDRIAASTGPGKTLEIGGGIGNLKERLADVISTDVQFAPWLDAVADAQRLPFAEATFDNLVMLDVLHHLEFPSLFFREANRVLRVGGRIVMAEPAITLGSTLFLRLFHQEPVRMRHNPLTIGVPDTCRDPYDANQAIPTLLVTRYREQFHDAYPTLRIARTYWFSLAAYPLSGGFKSWSLISEPFAKLALGLERRLEPWLGRLFGFRILIVVEKTK